MFQIILSNLVADLGCVKNGLETVICELLSHKHYRGNHGNIPVTV